jgi:hypothetical protein
MASPLWANYLVCPYFQTWGGQTVSPFMFGSPTPASGFINIGTQFGTGAAGGALYTVTALTPAVFAASNAGVGQDGLNPLPATSVHSGDTVTMSTLGTIPTTSLAGLIRVGG